MTGGLGRAVATGRGSEEERKGCDAAPSRGKGWSFRARGMSGGWRGPCAVGPAARSAGRNAVRQGPCARQRAGAARRRPSQQGRPPQALRRPNPTPCPKGCGRCLGRGTARRYPGRLEGSWARGPESQARWGRGEEAWRLPGRKGNARPEDVDPLALALPVAHAGQAAQVLSRGRSPVRAGASGQVSLSVATLRLAQRPGAAKPQVTSALFGGPHEQRGVAAQKLDTDLDGQIIEEDKGPGAAPCRPDVDLRALGVVGPGPRKREPLERHVALPEHLAAGAADGQVRSQDLRLGPPEQHPFGLLASPHAVSLSLPLGRRVVHELPSRPQGSSDASAARAGSRGSSA
jgi:hypothetical protein